MSALALEHVYRYPHASTLLERAQGPHLSLATCGGAEESPYFFEGRMLYPARTAALLRGLMQVVQSKFALSPAEIGKQRRAILAADPVVTSNDDRLRFEGFSACGSAYVRVDLLPEATAGDRRGRGTTNVDFNPPMLAALARLRDGPDVTLSVGGKEVRLQHGAGAVIEKKVPLPVRWLKGFAEVHCYQPRLQQMFEVSGVEALRFLRSLPATKSYATSWVVPAGSGLRLSQAPAARAAPIAGLERLKVVQELARHARRLRIYADRAAEVSAWELVLDEARFHLVLSPDPRRGFSGEGQLLTELAQGRWQEALAGVQASLCWQSVIDESALVQRVGAPAEAIRAALTALGSRGLVGYDLDTGAYFHRELPFKLDQVEQLQPRLGDARRLVAEDGVRRAEAAHEFYVRGSDVEHRVRLVDERFKCTCAWFSKHGGERGPCKHILAAQLVLDAETV
jgi:hypothetical protein